MNFHPHNFLTLLLIIRRLDVQGSWEVLIKWAPSTRLARCFGQIRAAAARLAAWLLKQGRTGFLDFLIKKNAIYVIRLFQC